jgi:hypothetical protein
MSQRIATLSDEIRNCEFRFKCPKTWDSLEKTPIAAQRYCGECQRIVIHCRTATELEWAIVRNLCVAISPVPSKKTCTEIPANDQLSDMLVGYPIMPPYSAD